MYHCAGQTSELPTMSLNLAATVLSDKPPPASISLCWANSLKQSSQAPSGYTFAAHANTNHLPVAAGEGRGEFFSSSMNCKATVQKLLSY